MVLLCLYIWLLIYLRFISIYMEDCQNTEPAIFMVINNTFLCQLTRLCQCTEAWVTNEKGQSFILKILQSSHLQDQGGSKMRFKMRCSSPWQTVTFYWISPWWEKELAPLWLLLMRALIFKWGISLSLTIQLLGLL